MERDLFIRVLIANILLDPLKVNKLKITEILRNPVSVEEIKKVIEKERKKDGKDIRKEEANEIKAVRNEVIERDS